MAELVFISGPLRGRHISIEIETVAGRSDADLELEDEEVSRRHAILRPAGGGGIEVEDLGSTNGTWVDGARISTPTLAPPGTTLRLGTSEARVAAESVRDAATRVANPLDRQDSEPPAPQT